MLPFPVSISREQCGCALELGLFVSAARPTTFAMEKRKTFSVAGNHPRAGKHCFLQGFSFSLWIEDNDFQPALSCHLVSVFISLFLRCELLGRRISGGAFCSRVCLLVFGGFINLFPLPRPRSREWGRDKSARVSAMLDGVRWTLYATAEDASGTARTLTWQWTQQQGRKSNNK